MPRLALACPTLAVAHAFGSSAGLRGSEQTISSDDASKVDVYYVTRMTDRFSAFTHTHQSAANTFHNQELQRLQTAIKDAESASDKELLERAAMFSEESRLEANNAFNEMANFVNTLKQAMGAKGSVSSCALVTCGQHAYCKQTPNLGAECRCADGYQGNGFVCNPAKAFKPQMLIEFRPDAPFPQVADVHVSTFDNLRVAVTYRDLARAHAGFLMLGVASKEAVVWGQPARITAQGPVFAPVSCQLLDGVPNTLAVAFRDADRGGTGFLAAGSFDSSNNVSIFSAKPFTRHQAQTMQIVALPGSNIAVLFAEHVLNGGTGRLLGGAMYGGALLARIDSAARDITILEKQRFAQGPVARISAAQLTPSSFVVAYRGGDAGADMKKSEASVVLGQLRGGELVFSAHTENLEPDATQIWARNVAPLSPDRFVYTYHSGSEQVTKQAILQVDATSRSLSVVRGPEVVAKGFSPSVGTVTSSMAQLQLAKLSFTEVADEDVRRAMAMPTRALTYFAGDAGTKARARICSITGASTAFTGCREVDWIDHDLVNLAGTAVGDGRLLFVFTNDKGTPFFEFVGLEDA